MPAGTEWHEAAEGRRLARARTRRPKADASSEPDLAQGRSKELAGLGAKETLALLVKRAGA